MKRGPVIFVTDRVDPVVTTVWNVKVIVASTALINGENMVMDTYMLVQDDEEERNN